MDNEKSSGVYSLNASELIRDAVDNLPHTTTPTISGQGSECPPKEPALLFIPLDDHYLNHEILLAYPCRFFALQMDMSTLTNAAWIHWTKFGKIDEDIDSLDALQQPGIFMGDGPTFTFNALGVVTGAQSSRSKIPVLKLCAPVSKILFTGWAEPFPTAASVNFQGLLICSNDIDEFNAVTLGGE
jgi:hypothetical protein